MGDSDFVNNVCDADFLLTTWLCVFVVSIVLLIFSFPYIKPANPHCCMCGEGYIVSDIIRLLADIFLLVILGFNAAGSHQYGIRMSLSILSIVTTVIFAVVRDFYLALLSVGEVSSTEKSKMYMQRFEYAEMGCSILIFIIFIVCACVDIDCRPWLLPPNVLTWMFYFAALWFNTYGEIPDSHAKSLTFAKIFEFSISWILMLASIFTVGSAFGEGISCEGDESCTKPNGWTGYMTASAILLGLLVSTSFGMGALEYQRLMLFHKRRAQQGQPLVLSSGQGAPNKTEEKEPYTTLPTLGGVYLEV